MLIVSNHYLFAEIGIICLSNHSYRNALRYEDDKEDIKELNTLLSKL